MKKYGLIAILLIIYSFSALGQEQALIDSLNRELGKQMPDTVRIKLLLKISKYYQRNDSKKAFEYIDKAKEIAERTNIDNEKAFVYLNEGKAYFTIADYSKAMNAYEKALFLYLKLNKPNKIAGCYLEIGVVHLELCDYGKALNYFSKSLKTYKALNHKRGMARCYASMGIVYVKQEKYAISNEYLQKAIGMTDDRSDIAHMFINIARNYELMGDYYKSLSYFDSIVPSLKERNDFGGLATAYSNFAGVYIDVKDYEKAKAYFKIAIHYASELGDTVNLLYTQTDLALLYTTTNQPDSAIILLKQVIELNKEYNIDELYENVYFNISEAYEKKGDTKSALLYYKQYHTVYDSVSKQLASQKLLDIQTQWEVDKKNEQIALLDKDKKLATQKAVSSGIALIAVSIAGLCFFIYRNKKNREQQLLHEAELKDAAYQIDFKHRELAHKAINLSQKEQIFVNIKQQLENVKIENTRGKETLLGVLSEIDLQLKQNAMEDFEKYFIEIHPEFYNNLKYKYTELTQTELRVCALIKLNLNSKEIADLTHKTIRSVEATRASIRKKMGLAKENLFDIIASL